MESNSPDKSTREVFRTRFSVLLMAIILLPWIILAKTIFISPRIENIITLIIISLVILLLAGINYLIVGDHLIFRIWRMKNGLINIHSIVKIERTYFPLASNAGSLKRLFGKTKKGSKIPFFLISLHNESRFLEKLKQINPEIEIKVQNKNGFYRFWDWDI